MKHKHLTNIFFFILMAAVFYACNTSESTVVVVEDSPETEEAVQQDTISAEEFTEITIGLVDTVSNFDPLFAENLSTQRTLSLIYDGLYTLDREGNPVPELVSQMQISDDSLEYVFTIDPNKYYHNSQIFTAGIGRRVTATDVKKAFERAAKPTVPGHAAELLMGISGFENFYLEQQSVYDEGQRVLDGVGGIQVLNQETIAIILAEKDPQFLQKLASPYLFIYPQEAVNNRNQQLAENPVGTGPYRLNRVESNGRIVLSRFESRNNNTQTFLINRVNLRSYSDEIKLFREFTNGQTDWIPEIGPAISDQIINENGDLQTMYQDQFQLVQNNANRINAFYLNQRSAVNHEWLINRLAYLTTEDFSTRGTVSLKVEDFEITEEAEPREQYYVSFTDDVFSRRVLTELQNTIFRPESSLVLFDIRVPTRQTSIYTSNSSSLQNALAPLDDDHWLRLDTQMLALYKDRVTGIEPTTVPWLLHIEQIRVRNSE